MVRRVVIILALFAGVLVLADRGLAMSAQSSAAREIKLHEGLREQPKVTFRGFPFTTQAVRGRFHEIDVTVRDLERGGIRFDRIDAHLKEVKLSFSEALKGRVKAVPVEQGEATVRIRYADLSEYLATRPGNIRLTVRGEQVVVTSTFGVPGIGSVEIEGTPTATVAGQAVRIVVRNVRVAVGSVSLTAAQRVAAAARASFSVPFKEMPFGIEVSSAELTPTALVVKASATGLVIDVT